MTNVTAHSLGIRADGDKFAVLIPRGTRLGRNVKVGEKVRTTDFGARTIRSGGTVDRKPRSAGPGTDADADEPAAAKRASAKD